jgi:hypothetical protein
MRKIVAILAMAFILLSGASAWAGERITLDCINMPGCCTITCAMIDLDCCGCGNGNGPLLAEFLSPKGEVLGTATFAQGWCCGETYGQLDKPVNSNDVCSIRLVKPQDDCTVAKWASLRVRCGDECCSKWHKVFKGDLWCWETIPVEQKAVTPPPPPPPPPAEPPAVEPEPETIPEFAPPPDSETEPEVIVVPGRG